MPIGTLVSGVLFGEDEHFLGRYIQYDIILIEAVWGQPSDGFPLKVGDDIYVPPDVGDDHCIKVLTKNEYEQKLLAIELQK